MINNNDTDDKKNSMFVGWLTYLDISSTYTLLKQLIFHQLAIEFGRLFCNGSI